MRAKNAIKFIPLTKKHFKNLTEWYNSPHIHQWWGEERKWNYKDIELKYRSYVEGYKLENSLKKPIKPFIINYEGCPVGYIQSYSLYDFPIRILGEKVNSSFFCGGSLDFFLGSGNLLGRGMGRLVLNQFLNELFWKEYKICVVSIKNQNIASKKCFEKIEFQKLKPLGNFDEEFYYKLYHNLPHYEQEEISSTLLGLNNDTDHEGN